MRVPYLYLVASGIAANMVPIYGDAYDGTVRETTFVAFKLTDANGMPVPTNRILWSTSPGAAVVAADSITDSYGIGLAEVSLGSSPGSYTFTASAGGQTYTFTAAARAVPTISLNGIANAGSANAGTPVAPGSSIAIFGSALSDFTDSASTARLPLAIDQVNVSFDVPSAGISVPGHLIFVSPSQVNVQVPWELEGQTFAQIKVTIDRSYGNVVVQSLSTFAPAFFEIATGVVAALDANYNVIGASNPIARGQHSPERRSRFRGALDHHVDTNGHHRRSRRARRLQRPRPGIRRDLPDQRDRPGEHRRGPPAGHSIDRRPSFESQRHHSPVR